MPSPQNIPRICNTCGKSFLARKDQIYCSIPCRNKGNKRPIMDRFFEKVERRIDTTCWIWIGAHRHKLGYGGFWNGKKWDYAHRVSYELFKEPIPNGYEVIHTCDNPFCVNPDHLLAGTHTDNMVDAKTKGRIKGGFYNISKKNRPLGEKHGQSKLTDNNVREIRRLYEVEGIGVTEIARRYNMGHAQIGAIAHRKAWIHIE